MKKKWLFYIVIFIICIGGASFIISKAEIANAIQESQINNLQNQTITKVISTNISNNIESTGFISNLISGIYQNIKHPLSILLLQIITIIIIARLIGYLFRKLGQPTVIGEIIAGIILGPSLLGLLFPQVSLFIFPIDSLNNLYFLSQIGLILFMFIVGMELDTGVIKNKTNVAMIISIGSVFFAFVIGVLSSFYLYPEFKSQNSSFFSFAVFMGIAMSITAFPVLARIMQEKQLTKTYLGAIAITIAAVDDVIGWCLLAAIIAIIKAGNIIGAFSTIGLTSVYVIIMLFVIKPILKRAGIIYVSKENLNKTIIALVFLFLLFSAYITEAIGIHALFGAFIAGVVMPKNNNFKNILIEKIEDISLVLLLPLFFVFTGLRTQIGLLNNFHLWFVCIAIIFIAIIGKFVGTAVLAKVFKQSWKDSISLGILMNTRGLMELIVLNIGYDLGILSNEIFTMLVIMAIITTFMTGPSLNILNYVFKRFETIKQSNSEGIKVLLSFANPQMGSKLLRVANFLYSKDSIKNEFTAVHFTPASGIETKNISQFEEEVFKPIKISADELGINLKTIYRITEQIQKEIISITTKDKSDLLLVGAAKSVFIENFIGGKIKGLIDKVNCPMGVFIDRDLKKINNALVITGSKNDSFLFDFCKHILEHVNTKLIVVDVNNSNEISISSLKNNLQNETQNRLEVINTKPDLQLLNQNDLAIISLEYWQEINHQKSLWNMQQSSLLIIKDKNLKGK